MQDTPPTLRIALAQIDPTVGDVEGNAAMIRDGIDAARRTGAQIVLFPESCLSGYPAEDLLLRRHFLASCRDALERLAAEVEGIVGLVGFPEAGEAGDGSAIPVHNSLAVLADGAIAGIYRKIRLPNYGVFDERRYFEPGSEPALIEVNGVRIGLTVCEDIWFSGPPASVEARAGAVLIVNASASPYHRGKGAEREAMVVERAREAGAAFAICNSVGGQDELVFDGHSVIVDAAGQPIARGRQFEQDMIVCDLALPQPDDHPSAVDGGARLLARIRVDPPQQPLPPAPLPSPLGVEAEVYAALVLGLRDYVDKNGFDRVVLALSGGIDSALVALIAADSLGPERVVSVVMPSPHSSAETQADARAIAANLGIETIEIPIETAMDAYADALAESFGAQRTPPAEAANVGTVVHGTAPGLAEENVQARIRGNLVMALSNKFGWLVLTTGNKSEMSVGYATLYGDMAGGFAVIKDVPKTLVYRLVRYRNQLAGGAPVPESVLVRPPSAELRPDQRDEDSLPPYDLLDRILEAYVERDQGRDEIVAAGLPAEVVDEVIAKVDAAEYKRRQAPPGIKITPKAFGRDRRLPITNRYRG